MGCIARGSAVPSQPGQFSIGREFPEDTAPGHPPAPPQPEQMLGLCRGGDLEQAGLEDLWLEGHLGQRLGELEMAAVLTAGILSQWDPGKLHTETLKLYLNYCLNNPG